MLCSICCEVLMNECKVISLYEISHNQLNESEVDNTRDTTAVQYKHHTIFADVFSCFLLNKSYRLMNAMHGL